MSEPLFDEVIHQSTRLRICAAAATGTAVEFSVLEEALAISTSLLSKQLKVLVDAGYVALDKRRGVGRPRTWVALTPAGRRAFEAHLAALRAIVGETDAASPVLPDAPTPPSDQQS